MDAAGVFLGAILIGGSIAIATGVIATVGLLRMLCGAGLHRKPPSAATSILARQRAVDARLRARYLQRQRPVEHVDDNEPVPSLDVFPGSLEEDAVPSLVGSLVNRLAG